jgi:membrane-associated phospholipid phosphatase
MFYRNRFAPLATSFLMLIFASAGQPAGAQTDPSPPEIASMSTPSLPNQPSAKLSATAYAALPDAPQPQSPTTGHPPLEYDPHPDVTAIAAPKHILFDLGHIFISPIYIRPRDLEWIAPLAGASIAAFATDTHVANDVVSHDPSFNAAAANLSDGMRDTMIAIPLGMYGAGLFTHNGHARETGILGGEAMIDAFVVDEVVKLVSFRERPYQDNGRGDFYQASAGVDSSFISGHAMIAWSSAAVIADEYRSPWIKVGVYALATGTSVDRVLALRHFPTDVLLGSAGGWLIGHYVYRAHHRR